VKLVIVDEDPLSEYTKSFGLTSDDLSITDDIARIVEDEDQRYALDALVDAMRAVLSTKWSAKLTSVDIVSGFDAISILDHVLMRRAAMSLRDVVETLTDETLDALIQYVPDEIVNELSIVHKGNRHVMTLITYVLDEAQSFYFRGVVEWNSRIHFYNGAWHVFPMQPLIIEPRVPVIVLDATGSKAEYVRAFSNRDVVVYEPSVRNPDTRTYAVINTEFTRTALTRGMSVNYDIDEAFALVGRNPCAVTDRLEDDYFKRITGVGKRKVYPNKDIENLTRIIAYLAVKHNGLLVITHRPVHYWMTKYFFSEYPKWRNLVAFDHFQATRGTNIYKDYPAVAVIGTPRPPAAIMFMYLQALYHDDYSPILNVMDRVPEPYHGTPHGYKTRVFQATHEGDTRAKEMFDQIEAGELEQSAGRIRPHTSDIPKTVYYFTSRPAGKWITDIVTIQDAVWEATQLPLKIAELYDHVDRGTLGLDAISVRALKRLLKLGQNRAIMVRDKYMELVNNGKLDIYLRSKGLML
jgi:hypothetical protein